MNDRDDLRRLIEADLDGEIRPDERARLEAALRDDPALAAEAAELRRLREVFRAVPPARAPDDFHASVVAATVGADGQAAEARAGFRLLTAAPWIAGIAAAALLVVLLGPWTGDLGSGARPVETADAPERALLDRKSEEAGAASEVDETLRRQRRGMSKEVAAGDAPPAPAKSVVPPATRETVAPEPVVEGQEADDDAVAQGGKSGSLRGGVGGRPSADPPADAPAGPVVVPGAEDATAGRGRGKSAPAPQPAAPTSPLAEAPQSEPGRADEPAAEGLRLESRTADVEAAPPRRYVVFEDEAAARRYLASLQPEAKDEAERSREAPEKPRAARPGSEADRAPVADGGDARGLATGAGFTALQAPRVLGRVRLATTDARVGAALARAPDRGAFGDAVPAGLLELAESRFKEAAAALAKKESRGEQPGELSGAGERVAGAKTRDAEAADELVDGREAGGPTTGGGAGAGSRAGADTGSGADVPAEPGAPATTTADVFARGSKRKSAEIEIVVVVVPPGTLPPRPATGGGR